MSTSPRARLLIALLLLIAAGVFCMGITWGLPSRAIDPYLFGDEPVWSGEKILQLAGERKDDRTRGADVDIDPLAERDKIIWVNETDEQRAAILLRYRLYTYQPDEMITMMSLASMRPGSGDLDPKLYQYGGLWIYPVGGFLKLASLCGAVTLTNDLAYYLDHPEAFGRFYVVARLYVVAWALVGVWVVFWIMRRLTGGSLLCATAAAALYVTMPVVINMAHEAKPHLPGVVLMLLAVMAAVRYVETGRRFWWLMTSCACGFAFGMVLSALPIFIILPVMTLLRRPSWFSGIIQTLIGSLVGLAVYLVTNPYVPINFLVNREVLRSNLDNSLAMYEIARWFEGLLNAAWLVGEGTSVLLAAAGVVGVASLAIAAMRTWRSSSHSREGKEDCCPSAPGWLLAAPALLILLQFVALAAGKPGEYGRFALFPDIVLGIVAVLAAHRFVERNYKQKLILAGLFLVTVLPGSSYLIGFINDASAETSRIRFARKFEQFKENGAETLGIQAEPAPYVLPPVDLFKWRLLLIPKSYTINNQPGFPDALVRVKGTPKFAVAKPSPYVGGYAKGPVQAISWADKWFDCFIKKDLFAPTSRKASTDAY